MTQEKSLADQLREAVAFDENYHLGPNGGICRGCAAVENKRIQPILEKLIALVEASEKAVQITIVNLQDKALTELRAELERMSK